MKISKLEKSILFSLWGLALFAFIMLIFLLTGSYLIMFLSTLILVVSLTSLIIAVIRLLSVTRSLKKMVENSGQEENKIKDLSQR